MKNIMFAFSGPAWVRRKTIEIVQREMWGECTLQVKIGDELVFDEVHPRLQDALASAAMHMAEQAGRYATWSIVGG